MNNEAKIFTKPLSDKLDRFINGFYTHLLKVGAVKLLLITSAILFTVLALEWMFYLKPSIKIALIVGAALVTLVELFQLVLRPLGSLLGVYGRMSHEEAAVLVGKGIDEVDDRLLNAVQLMKANRSQLIDAGIEAYNQELSKFDWLEVIDRKEIVRWALFLASLLALVAGVSVFQGKAFSAAGLRLLDANKSFSAPLPYRLVDATYPKQAKVGELVVISGKFEGSILPSTMRVSNGKGSFFMQNKGNGLFTYAFTVSARENELRFMNHEYSSETFRVEGVYPPSLSAINFRVEPPPYTGLPSLELNALQAQHVPKGSQVTIQISGLHVQEFRANKTSKDWVEENGVWTYSARIMEPIQDTLAFVGAEVLSETLDLNVIADLAPKGEVKSNLDTATGYFEVIAEVSDDYGLSRIVWMVNDKVVADESVQGSQLRKVRVFEQDDLNEVVVRVYDNDGLAGPKMTELGPIRLKELTRIEKRKIERELASQSGQIMAENRNRLKEVQEEVQNLVNQLKMGGDLSWEQKQKLSELTKEQQTLLENLKEKTEPRNKEESSEKVLNELSEQHQEKLDELERLLDKLKPDELQEKLEAMKLSAKEMEEALDRNLELLKRMEVEEDLKAIADELDRLGDEQLELSKKADEQHKAQEEISKKTDEALEMLEEVMEKNKDLKSPLDLPSTQEESGDIQNEQNKAEEDLKGDKQNAANKSQKKAGDQLKATSGKMKGGLSSAQKKQQEEDLEALRQLLDNLVVMSFNQERELEVAKKLRSSDPDWKKTSVEQQNIADDFEHVADSLKALGGRLQQLQPIIAKEVADVRSKSGSLTNGFFDLAINERLVKQQELMMGLNNLALLIDEVSNAIQKQMAESKFGTGACKKPGASGAPKPGKIKGMQKELAEQMKGMKQKGGKGKKEGGQPGGNSSKEFAKMAAKQAAIREAMRKLEQSMKKGKGGGGGLEGIGKKMEETEWDLLNKEITEETIKRQEEILSRLLEAVEAEREREQEERREAEQANPEVMRKEALEKYLEKRKAELERVRFEFPDMYKYYKEELERYERALD